MRSATARIRSRSPTEVPPNFCTTRAKRRPPSRAKPCDHAARVPAEAVPRRGRAISGQPQAGVYIVGPDQRSNPGAGSHPDPSEVASPVPDPSSPDQSSRAAGADPDELRRFAELADRWWDEAGPMAPLHKLNPTRLAYIRRRVCERFGRDPNSERPLA